MTFKYICGGTAGAVTNAGIYNDAVTTLDNTIGVNGTFLVSTNNCTVTNNGSGKVRLTNAAAFGAAILGAFARVDFNAYVDGTYEIITIHANYIDLELAFGAPEANTGAVIVGGALGDADEGLQYAFDNLSHAKLWRDIAIYTDITTNATVDVDAVSGLLATRITVEGVDATGVRLTAGATRPIITTTADLDIGLINIKGGMSYYDFRFLDLDGGGTDKADNCITGTSGGNLERNNRFFDCALHDADEANVKAPGYYWSWARCEIYNAGAEGGIGPVASTRNIDSHYMGCSFHDNTGYGLQIDSENEQVLGCLFFGNTGNGLEIEANADRTHVMNCTIFNNGGVGIFIDKSVVLPMACNTTSCYNTGVNWDFDGVITHLCYFAHNHSFGGGGLTSDGVWADIGEGMQITGDPKFASIVNGAEDPTPDADSPLLGASVACPARLAIAGDPVAVINYGFIGAVQGAVNHPATGDVQEDVTFGTGSVYTGTMVVPPTGDVRVGVNYGDDSEFTGTFGTPMQPNDFMTNKDIFMPTV